MTWRVTRLTANDVLPLERDTVKEHLNIALTDGSQDDKLDMLIVAAKERLERDIDRVIMSCSFRMTGPCFGNRVRIDMQPVTSVTSVRYIDADGAEQTLDSADYRWLSDRREIWPAIGSTFPDTYSGLPDAVTVEYTVGYGNDAGCIPRLIKQAMLLCIGKWFFDPAMESSALHSSEQAYKNIIRNLSRETYP